MGAGLVGRSSYGVSGLGAFPCWPAGALSGAGELTVRIGDAVHAFPAAGEVRVIVDGPALEVRSRAGLFGAPIAPRGDTLTVTAGDGSDVTVHPPPR